MSWAINSSWYKHCHTYSMVHENDWHQWFCPACDHVFLKIDKSKDFQPVLKYHAKDPFLDSTLQDFLAKSEEALPGRQETKAHLQSHGLCRLLAHAPHSWLAVDIQDLEQWHKTLAGLSPPEFRWAVIWVVHESFGHAGIERPLTVMHQHFHGTGINADTASYCMHCDACQRQKLMTALPFGWNSPLPVDLWSMSM